MKTILFSILLVVVMAGQAAAAWGFRTPQPPRVTRNNHVGYSTYLDGSRVMGSAIRSGNYTQYYFRDGTTATSVTYGNYTTYRFNDGTTARSFNYGF